jgi:hypothetical protein
MIIGRFFGLLFVVFGILVLLRDLWASYVLRTWSPISLYLLWAALDPAGYGSAKATVQEFMGPRVWDIVDAMLVIWASVAFLAVGIALMIAFRRRRDVIE